MSARTSYILVIIRVCVGEREMAGVSQNSSGGGRVIGGYAGTHTAFLEPPFWHPGVRRPVPGGGLSQQPPGSGAAASLALLCGPT